MFVFCYSTSYDALYFHHVFSLKKKNPYLLHVHLLTSYTGRSLLLPTACCRQKKKNLPAACLLSTAFRIPFALVYCEKKSVIPVQLLFFSFSVRCLFWCYATARAALPFLCVFFSGLCKFVSCKRHIKLFAHAFS
ncbi:transmembrane protein, putative [Bodo saltans]|uniref:Transmembrane protein, putative n=1 Tax=Bodo saltans TaxID=75058 RepID=A0A0S4J428_BODSA|nr:transmembrane protein, putative [Bodo saltans]|eukprot:CUG74369.1 transmembrane protein, putative [Bodo saltans]